MTGSNTATEESATESNTTIAVDDEAETNNGTAKQVSEDAKGKKSMQNGKKSSRDSAADSGAGDWAFPYRLGFTWSVWYDRPSAKKISRSDYSGSMKHIYQFDSVKAFWGLYNHLNLEKMPVGANLRIFKKDIQPTWEAPENSQGGNWILVPRPRDVAGIVVYKELLLAIIGGDLDHLVNGIVLSIKAKDIIIQMWLPSTSTTRRNKVKKAAEEALRNYCPQVDSGGHKLDWTWRAHPTVMKKPDGDSHLKAEATLPGEDGLPRGSCGECLGKWKSDCSIQ